MCKCKNCRYEFDDRKLNERSLCYIIDHLNLVLFELNKNYANKNNFILSHILEDDINRLEKALDLEKEIIVNYNKSFGPCNIEKTDFMNPKKITVENYDYELNLSGKLLNYKKGWY